MLDITAPEISAILSRQLRNFIRIGRISCILLPDPPASTSDNAYNTNFYPLINVKFSDRQRYYDFFDSYYKDNTVAPILEILVKYLEE